MNENNEFDIIRKLHFAKKELEITGFPILIFNVLGKTIIIIQNIHAMHTYLVWLAIRSTN